MQFKMKANDIIDPTLCNRYPNDDEEFIFAYRGRPFGCLLSPHLPTPTSTLVDFNLVKDLGMKMYDLQYQKFFTAGISCGFLEKCRSQCRLFMMDSHLDHFRSKPALFLI